MAARGLTDIYARLPRVLGESADISVKPQAHPCYNIYVTPPNPPCPMCSAHDDIVSKSLIVKEKGKKNSLIISVCNLFELSRFWSATTATSPIADGVKERNA